MVLLQERDQTPGLDHTSASDPPLQRRPSHFLRPVLSILCEHLDPRSDFQLATLFRDEWQQSLAYFRLHSSAYAARALDAASACGNVALLQRLLRTSPTLARATYSSDAIRLACQNGHTAVLQWWLDSGLPLRYSAAVLTAAADKGHLHVLAWWRASGLKIRLNTDAAYSRAAVDAASCNGHVDVLQWWRDSGHRLRYSTDAVDDASYAGHLAVLEWWRRQATRDGGGERRTRPLRIKYTYKAMGALDKAEHVAVLDWWKASGLPLKLPNERTLVWNRNKISAKVMRWWLDNWVALETRVANYSGCGGEGTLPPGLKSIKDLRAVWGRRPVSETPPSSSRSHLTHQSPAAVLCGEQLSTED
ncbi:hypothetical protein DFJ73DRAFT_660309 [Zopfochytrium polystomum]|nr:hypothetical protein DFJ73DRAFT_660309 [Zopfochytrium polystomum]